MHINPAQATAPKPAVFDQLQRLGGGCRFGRWQLLQGGQDLYAVLQVSAGQFTQDEGMHENLSVGELARQCWLSSPEVLNPDRGIGEHH